LAIDEVLRGIEKRTLLLFPIGCRDSGNVLEPMMTISRELEKISGRNQFYAVDVEMLMVR
jgi:hypothetical protein